MNVCYFQAYYFDRDDVALKGFSKFFKDSADEEREHAEKFMKYQNMRGGRVVLQSIQVLFCQSLHKKICLFAVYGTNQNIQVGSVGWGFFFFCSLTKKKTLL